MPIPLQTGPTTPPDIPPGTTPPGGHRPPDEEFTLTLASPDGSRELFLSGSGKDPYMARPGLQGIDLPPVQIATDELPFDDGSLERGIRFTDRDIWIPLRVRGASYSKMRTLKHALYDLVDPKSSLVDVVVGQPDGSSRRARGRYAGGAEGSYGADEFGLEWQVLGLTIQCFDPYFYGAPISMEWATAGDAKAFLSETTAFFPIMVNNSQVIGDPIDVDNPGDADAYGVWRFDGPFDDVTVASVTTGRSWTITETIATGDWIDVDTRPGTTSIRDQDDTNLWGSLSTTEDDLFPIGRGANVLQLTMTGANADTRAALSMAPRYRAA